MISLRSFMSKSLPNLRRFYGGARTLVTQKYDDVQLSPEKKTAIVGINFPFLPDRAGLVPMAKFPQLAEVANQAIKRNCLLQIPETDAIFSEVLVVAKSHEVNIFPQFYNNMQTNGRLFVHCSIRDSGTTSFNEQFHIYDETNTVLLWEMITTMVTCDLKMKPIPTPEPFSELISSVATHKQRSFIPPPFTQRPAGDVFTTHVVPRPSDLDVFYHVNQSNYVTFMLDAAVIAAKAGVYESLRQDIAFGAIAQIIVNYHKELHFDDDVAIETWQDEENALRICFQMSTGSQMVFQGSILLQEPLLRLSDEVKIKLPRAKDFHQSEREAMY